MKVRVDNRYIFSQYSLAVVLDTYVCHLANPLYNFGNLRLTIQLIRK